MFRRQSALATFALVLFSGALHAENGSGWNAIEASTEKSFQEVIGSCDESRNDLANLNVKLERYGWSLTRYTVQLLHELEAGSLPQASERLNDDRYASVALRDAMWDGFNGWSIVSSLRSETLEVLQQLEAVRTGAANLSGANGGQAEKLADKAQKVTERLFKEAGVEGVQLNARNQP